MCSCLIMLLLHGCSPSPSTVLTFDAIDSGGRLCPCMFVLNGDWAVAAEGRNFANVAADDVYSIVMPAGWESVEIIAVPITVASGQVVQVPKSRKEAGELVGFASEARLIRRTDPPRHLFILSRVPR